MAVQFSDSTPRHGRGRGGARNGKCGISWYFTLHSVESYTLWVFTSCESEIFQGEGGSHWGGKG